MDIEKLIGIADQRLILIQVIERKARKPWGCETCKKEIWPGSKYWNRVVRIYGQPISEPYLSEHFCLDCEPERNRSLREYWKDNSLR